MANPFPFRFGARKHKTAEFGYGPSGLYVVVVWAVVLVLGFAGCTAAPSPAWLPSAMSPPVMPPLVSSPVMVTAIAATPLDGVLRITVDATNEMQYTAVKLLEPLRLVVDIANAELTPELKPLVLTEGLASGVEPSVLPDQGGVRIVVPLRQAVSHLVSAEGQQLHITLTESAAHAVTAAMPLADARPVVAATSAPAAIVPTMVTGVAFRSLPGQSVIEVQMVGALPLMQIKQLTNPLRLMMDVGQARLSSSQATLMAVHDPAGVVTQLQAIQSDQSQDDRVHIVAYLRTEAPFEVRQDGQQVQLILTPPAVPQSAASPAGLTTGSMGKLGVSTPGAIATQPVAVSARWPHATESSIPPLPGGPMRDQVAPAMAGQMTQAEPVAGTPPMASMAINVQEEKKYIGEKISLDFQNADINDILRLIAEVSRLNIIAGPDVKGTVTTHMMDVPWDQALEVVLRINGLDQERDNNILRVAPVDRFITERQERLRAQKAEIQAEPTVTQIVPISYADVEELKTNLERVLSERGKIWVDSRTNTMIVTDVAEQVTDVLSLVKTLDRQTAQVMIESRIVEASRQFLRELGVQLGTRFTKVTDRNFPSTIAVDGGIASGDGTDSGNFLVDLPAAVGQGRGGAISFALAGASSLLNVQLSALENSGKGKVVTNPKIATLDNTEAIIESGRRIPYATRSNDGTKIEFADASIKLRVTPHVAPDGFIDLKIHATKNEADFSRTAGDGVPTILKREATTEMLVRDGDTVVIGGLYQRTLSDSRDGVPWLSRLPVLGWLFKKESNIDNQDELLIFITPRIIKQPDVPQQAHALLSN